MDALIQVLQAHGPSLLFAVGLAEFGGLPIAAVPVLLASGALASAGGLSLPTIALAAALGGLTADAAWFYAARFGGDKLVAVACALSSNRNACVTGVESRVRRVGPLYLLWVKFIPGAGNLVAAAAGFGRLPARVFLSLDAIGLVLWSTTYAGLGWLLTDQIDAVLASVSEYSQVVASVLLMLVIAGAGARLIKLRNHGPKHGRVESVDAAGACAAQPGEPVGEPLQG